MTRFNRAAQVIKPELTILTLVALPHWLRLIPPLFHHPFRVTLRTTDTFMPPELTHGFITLLIVD